MLVWGIMVGLMRARLEVRLLLGIISSHGRHVTRLLSSVHGLTMLSR